MKKYFLLFAILYVLTGTAVGQNVGIGTENPTALLDVNGDVVYRNSDLNVIDSLTLALDVNSSKFSNYRISGAASAFVIAGITAGMDGRIITLINESGFPMILHHKDTNAIAADRIITGNSENLELGEMGLVTLQYDASSQKWIVNSSNHVPRISDVWDTTGTNIFFNNYVGIGTDEPIAPLTLQTAVDEVGFSQTAGDDSITLQTVISDVAASIGTSSDHVFSLSAGGEGKVHIWPNGDVLIGEDSIVANIAGGNLMRDNDFDSKLSVMTGLGETGYKHIAGDNEIIVDESIGQSSASLGTMTNNSFRLKTNGIGRFHVWYDGSVVVGSNTDAPNSQFTVFTPPNAFGISHTTTGGIVLESHIGTSSAGFGTYSNNEFRLVSNGATVLTCAPSGNVGIGTTNPPRKLSIYTDPGNFGVSHSSSGGIEIADHIGVVSASYGTRTNHKFRLVANDQNVMTIHPNGNVGIGIDDPVQKLAVNGTIRAKEVIVELADWPDYVFNNDYKLQSLVDLESFIQDNHHLPNIPSAKEMEDSGQYLGEVQRKMMEKIEELTLHVIELNKKIEALEKGNQH